MQRSYHHVFIPGTDPLAPPVLLLHGTGGNENDLIPLGQSLSPGSALLSPRGDVSENGMPRFFRRFAEGVFDLADVEQRTQALADFIGAATALYGIDPAKLVTIGYSNGANIAASLLWLRPETLASAVLLRPMVVLEPKSLPTLNGKRILISSGQHDPIVPVDHPIRLANRFREAGAEVTLNSHAGGHGLTQADFVAARQFLNRNSP
ncbi:MAG: alpha/beta hydrolase [Lacunisphaera sp.]